MYKPDSSRPRWPTADEGCVGVAAARRRRARTRATPPRTTTRAGSADRPLACRRRTLLRSKAAARRSPCCVGRPYATDRRRRGAGARYDHGALSRASSKLCAITQSSNSFTHPSAVHLPEPLAHPVTSTAHRLGFSIAPACSLSVCHFRHPTLSLLHCPCGAGGVAHARPAERRRPWSSYGRGAFPSISFAPLLSRDRERSSGQVRRMCVWLDSRS